MIIDFYLSYKNKNNNKGIYILNKKGKLIFSVYDVLEFREVLKETIENAERAFKIIGNILIFSSLTER